MDDFDRRLSQACGGQHLTQRCPDIRAMLFNCPTCGKLPTVCDCQADSIRRLWNLLYCLENGIIRRQSWAV